MTEFRTERGCPNIWLNHLTSGAVIIEQPQEFGSPIFEKIIVPDSDVRGFLIALANKAGIKITIPKKRGGRV